MTICTRCKEPKLLKEMLSGKRFCKKCHTDYSRKYRERNREQIRDNERRYTARHGRLQKKERVYSEKDYVNGLVHKAVESGKLIRASLCEKCFKSCKTVGHHEDYNFPYIVEWLCVPCHNKHHNSHIQKGNK